MRTKESQERKGARTFEGCRNPILPPWIHIPDAEAHVFPDGTLGIFGSFDDREDLYCSSEYHPVTTRDLHRFTVHETSLRGEEVPWFGDPDAPHYPGIDWLHPTPFLQRMIDGMRAAGEDLLALAEREAQQEKPPLLFAPDCAYRDGRYYLYFCMNDDSEGVAVADRPEGPYTDITRFPIGGIDPAVFVDDDGKAYLYWGQIQSHGARLAPDMVSLVPGSQTDGLLTEEEHFFHEGSSMRKIGGTYYCVYADLERGKPTSLGYATGPSPLGPFTYRGIVIDNAECDPESWNNHGSIECVNGQWYVFYHRASRGGQMHRRLCIEKLEILPDGTIPEVLMTSQGLGEPFAPGERIEGWRACGVHGGACVGPLTEEEARAEGIGAQERECQEYLRGLTEGASAIYRYVRSDKAYTGVRIEASGRGRLLISLDDIPAGEILITGEGSGSRMASYEAAIAAPAGQYTLRIEVKEGENLLLDAITLW